MHNYGIAKRCIQIKKINFDNIVYINLDKSIDRNTVMKSQIDEYTTGAKRFSGIDKDFDAYCHDWKIFLNSNNEQMTYEEIGCLLSHLEVIRIYGDRDLIVLEDDIDLSTSLLWNFTMSEFLDGLDEEIHILQMTKHWTFTPIEISDMNRYSGFGNAAYYIRPQLSSKIISQSFINGKWSISSLPLLPQYTKKVADTVFYSLGHDKTCTLFSVHDFESSINKENPIANKIGYDIKNYLASEDLTLSRYYTGGLLSE